MVVRRRIADAGDRQSSHDARGDIAEGHCRAERDAAGGVVAAEDRCHVVAGGKEARDDISLLVEDSGARGRLQPGKRAEAAGDDPYGVVGAVLQRAERGVQRTQRIALDAVIGRASPPEIGVVARSRLRINIAGPLITMPHKVSVVSLLGEASTAVKICGACNAVKRDAEGRLVGEVVMTREVTHFLAAARKRGCATQVGLDMLFEQIPAYLEFFGFPAATAEELRRTAKISDRV